MLYRYMYTDSWDLWKESKTRKSAREIWTRRIDTQKAGMATNHNHGQLDLPSTSTKEGLHITSMYVKSEKSAKRNCRPISVLLAY